MTTDESIRPADCLSLVLSGVAANEEEAREILLSSTSSVDHSDEPEQHTTPNIRPPYNIGDKCEWLYIARGYWHDEADRPPGIWIEAEVLFWQYSNHGYDMHIRTGFGFPSTWTRWIWVDFDGNGWDRFPDRYVRPDEVAECCRLRLRKPQETGA